MIFYLLINISVFARSSPSTDKAPVVKLYSMHIYLELIVQVLTKTLKSIKPVRFTMKQNA